MDVYAYADVPLYCPCTTGDEVSIQRLELRWHMDWMMLSSKTTLAGIAAPE